MPRTHQKALKDNGELAGSLTVTEAPNMIEGDLHAYHTCSIASHGCTETREPIEQVFSSDENYRIPYISGRLHRLQTLQDSSPYTAAATTHLPIVSNFTYLHSRRVATWMISIDPRLTKQTPDCHPKDLIGVTAICALLAYTALQSFIHLY